jgi:hypothetical protein
VSYLDIELEMCAWVKMSCWTTSARTRLVSHSIRLSKGTLKGRQSILPCGDGTFPTIQLPLLGKELPLHLDGHRI